MNNHNRMRKHFQEEVSQLIKERIARERKNQMKRIKDAKENNDSNEAAYFIVW